jgi:hypothetical protein
MTDRPARPAIPKPMSQEERVKTAIELLQRIKHQSIEVEGEARKVKSQRLIDLSFEIDGAATDALNALFGVKV